MTQSNATSIENYTAGAVETESIAETGHILADSTAIRLMLDAIAKNGQIVDRLKRRVFYGTGETIRVSAMSPQEGRLATVDRLLHGLFTLATEAGEIAEVLIDFVEQGDEIDAPGLAAEIGDASWGLAIAADSIGFTLEECLVRNRAKLAKRYKKGWTQDAALNRDLAAERAALEGENV